ncbi:MAG: diaminopimelate epimerase [Clostridiaceae bacterium]
MEFYKLNGIGNDFILIDDRNGYLQGRERETAALLCNRHFSIGADGILLLRESKISDIKMDIYNSDGSYASMCGNGIRCFAKYAYEMDKVNKNLIDIETGDGIKKAFLNIENGIVSSVKINMGKVTEDKNIIDKEIEANGRKYIINTYHMGVPHTVIYGKLDSFDVNEGKYIEKMDIFKQGTNVNFVEVINNNEFKIMTYERGAGPTLACGTGTCASFYYLNSRGKVKDKALAHLVGGDLIVEKIGSDIYMEGPAEISFKGEVMI